MEVKRLGNIWRYWGDFNGHFEYYVYKSGDPLCKHTGLVVRRLDTLCTLRIDLLIGNYGWMIHMESTEWNPGSDNEVKTSENEWNPAMVVYALYIFSKNFGSWNLLIKNCQHFTFGLQQYMRENHRDCVTQAPIATLDDLRRRATVLGLRLISIEN